MNHSELPWRPWTARQLHLSIHMKDPLSIGGRQLARQLVITPENKMSCQGKETSRYVIWTIQSCHTLEEPFNCILGQGILHMSSKMQLMGSSRVPWRYWMVQMMLSCLNMTSHSHLTIANWNASCLSPISDGSSKFIHRCSWQATPGIYDSSEWLLWQTLLFSCLNMTSHSQLTTVNSCACRLP